MRLSRRKLDARNKCTSSFPLPVSPLAKSSLPLASKMFGQLVNSSLIESIHPRKQEGRPRRAKIALMRHEYEHKGEKGPFPAAIPRNRVNYTELSRSESLRSLGLSILAAAFYDGYALSSIYLRCVRAGGLGANFLINFACQLFRDNEDEYPHSPPRRQESRKNLLHLRHTLARGRR